MYRPSARRARRRDFADELAIEVAKHDNHALARRLGFLVSHIAGTQAARPFLPLLGARKAATPVEPGSGGDGAIDTTWRVRENVAVDRLLQHRDIG